MKQRILSLDLARGFTVAFITPVHTMLLLGKPSVHESWLGIIFRFVSEGPGAQLFMLLMGISFALSGKKSSGLVLKRALLILLLGYLLNALKFGLPVLFGLMPDGLMEWLEVPNNSSAYLKLIFTGDILQLAGLSLMVLLLCNRIFVYRFLYFVLAVVICFVSPLFWDIKTDWPVADHFLGLIGGQPPRVFFPLFPWLIYPVFGFYVGSLLKSGFKLRLPKLWTGSIFIAVTGVLIYYFSHFSDVNFYRTASVETIMHLLAVLVWLYVWHMLSKWIPFNKFFELLCWLSKHITLVYFIQWPFIFWLLPVFGFQAIGFYGNCVLIFLVVVNVWGLVYIINAIRHP